MKLLEVQNINVCYGDIQVLWDISFEIDKGEIVSLIGSNGAGKTSTLRAISQILKIKSGTIKLVNREIHNDTPFAISRSGVSHIPEGRELFLESSVIDNLKLGALYTVHDNSKKNQLLEQVFTLFPRLKDRKNQVAGSLSGGEQQMLAIARGLMADPILLMLDEPSLGLAPIIVSELFSTILEINKRGVTILLVEQNVHKTLEICDRAYVLETGSITKSGVGHDLLKDNHIKKAYLGI